MPRRAGAKEAGMVMAVIMMIALIYTLFSSPAIGAVPDSSYPGTLSRLGLEFISPEQATSTAAVEEFAYKTYDYASLVKPGNMSTALPAALVRAVTQPFGRNFSTRILAIVYSLILSLGAYLLVSGLYRRIGNTAYAVGLCVTVLFMQSGITGYLNSLYDAGAIITFFEFYVCCLTNAMCRPRGSGTGCALRVAFAGLLLMTSQAQMIILAPFVAAGVILAALHARPLGPRSSIHFAALGAALLYCAVSAFTLYSNCDDIHSTAANYLAVFQSVLTSSDDPESDLKELGLDKSFLPDVGKSYYEASENFARDPRSDEVQKLLSEKLNAAARLKFCLKHPERVLRRVEELRNHFLDTFNERIVSSDGNLRFIRLSPYIVINLFVSGAGFAGQSAFMLAAAALCALLAFFALRKSGARGLFISLGALFLGLTLYLPWCVALTGGTDIYTIKVVFLFFGWAAFFGICAVAICGVRQMMIWLGEKNGRVRMGSLETAAYAPLTQSFAYKARITRGGIVWTSAIVCVAIVCALLLPEKHIGGVNNGDYGRMMEQIDIYWTQELLDNSEEQAGIRVVERYDYREPFHPERLTPKDPTYSLIFPSMVSRVINEEYDTRVTAFVMLGLTIAGILVILYSLYTVMGRFTVLIAIGLVAMLLGENYVAWYNSLFGESSASTGLVMTIACAVRLCTLKRGSKSVFLWLILLCLSVRFLVCAKAQMALGIVGGLALIVTLSWAHRPKGAIRLCAFWLVIAAASGLVCWDAYGVYMKNDDVSARQTVWQSVFYGALMIADDPEAAMEELNIPPEMAADIGKHAYYPDEDYVYPIMSDEATEKFYSKVNTMTMVKYYLRHPKDLLYMLDRAARESVDLNTSYMAYTDEIYAQADGPYRFGLWRAIRPMTACGAFWQYVLLYGAAVIYCARLMLSKKAQSRNKLLAFLFLCIMCIGVLQYPLSVVGNGFADNNKQLYGFMLCHDIMVVAAFTFLARALARNVLKREAGGAYITSGEEETL